MLKVGQACAVTWESSVEGTSTARPRVRRTASGSQVDFRQDYRALGLPGAFTPTCSAKHVPSYIENFDALKAGESRVLVRLGERPFVMGAWVRTEVARQGADDGDGSA